MFPSCQLSLFQLGQRRDPGLRVIRRAYAPSYPSAKLENVIPYILEFIWNFLDFIKTPNAWNATSVRLGRKHRKHHETCDGVTLPSSPPTPTIDCSPRRVLSIDSSYCWAQNCELTFCSRLTAFYSILSARSIANTLSRFSTNINHHSVDQPRCQPTRRLK